jgi:hypothetical protein
VALRGIYQYMADARSGGDEWAAEFLTEEWPHLVRKGGRAAPDIDDD